MISKTLNVAILAESLAYGGISKYCLELAAACQNIPGIRPYLAGVSDNRGRWMVDESSRRGLTLHTFTLSGRYDTTGFRKITKFIVDYGIDIVHTQGYRLNLMTRMARALYRIPVKLVNTVHGVHAFRTAKTLSRLYYLCDYGTFFMSDGIICVSSQTARTLTSWHVPRMERAVIIHNGVEAAASLDDVSLGELRSQIGLRGRETTIGFVGRLSNEKGIGFLCRVARELIKQHRTYQFLIVGDGPLRPQVEELRTEWPENIKYLGMQDDVHPFLQLMGVLVVTSQTEGMPMIILEGFSHGVPVVSTCVGGVPEVVTDTVTGSLCGYNDSDGMIDRVVRILSNRAQRASMSANCIREQRTKYSSRLMAEGTYDFYKRVAASE